MIGEWNEAHSNKDTNPKIWIMRFHINSIQENGVPTRMLGLQRGEYDVEISSNLDRYNK